MKKMIVCCVILTWVSFVKAGPKAMLSLKEAVEIALSSNPDIRKSALQRTGEEYDLEVTAEQWSPQWQWRSQIESNKQSTALHMGYQLPWGTQINSSVGQGTTTPFALQVTQPLLKGQGKKTTLAPLFMAEEQAKLAEWQRVQQISDLLTQVISQYRQLQLLKKQIDIQKRLVEQAEKSIKNIELRIKAGRNPDNDKLQAQLEVMRQTQSLSETERLAEQVKNGFDVLLGQTEGSWTTVEDFQERDLPLSDLSTYQEYAEEHHPQLQQLKIQATINERAMWVAKDALKWDLSAVGSVSSDLEGIYGGLQLTVPLGNKKTQRQALVRVALEKKQWEITVAQTQQTIGYHIKNAWQEVQAKARQRALSQESLKIARASLVAVEQKFNTGRTASFELVAMQQQLQQIEVEAISMTLLYYDAMTQLEAASGMILKDLDKQHG